MIQLENTQEAYKVTVNQLIRRYMASAQIKSFTHDDLPLFAEWLITIVRVHVGPSSWRTYRYQLTQCIKESNFCAAINVAPAKRKRDMSNDEKGSYRTRRLKDETLTKIIGYLKYSKSKYAKTLERTLILGRLTGLRPSEWNSARIRVYEGVSYLYVQSVIKGRRESESAIHTRSIPLDHLTEFEFDTLIEHLDYLSQNPPYNIIHEGIMLYMRSVTRTLFYGSKERPTLYSARHQFAANLKASGISPVVIAQVMGHVDTDMQTRYYGRTSSGYKIAFNEALAKQLNSASAV